ncbi:phosphatidylserine decarboxylase [Ureibacillus sinduriensis]|uniref:phosphatidylserine decarboxylase n=1 Tax=Ureibacillus sinduriensis BLB-1 = JCM 15800 TaxID=1384057 RepID=A0A0A3HPJ9_9BACL|nr:phosphatidylserine decarboxylase [Ureibacillus sinduriensis]KGR74496.1 phosphatidylserine decarboxylase [Ureibacillus sinduriensis BLB-1 = JCM 15800]
MKEKIYQSLIELTNGKYSSLLLKRLVSSPMSKNLIGRYSKVYEIDTTEVSSDLDSFASLQDFFTRQLKKEARPVNQSSNLFVSPVDAKVESYGRIDEAAIFTVKGKPYTIMELMGNEHVIDKYRKGKYVVFYLSPANYHRIHSPIDGTVIRQYSLGNKSYPVNQLGLTYGKNPISKNYRMVSEVKVHDKKHVTLVKVGAMFVNSITLTNVSTAWKKGEEIGFFGFGSTVVMLFEEDFVTFTENIKKGHNVKMGEPIASML